MTRFHLEHTWEGPASPPVARRRVGVPNYGRVAIVAPFVAASLAALPVEGQPCTRRSAIPVTADVRDSSAIESRRRDVSLRDSLTAELRPRLIEAARAAGVSEPRGLLLMDLGPHGPTGPRVVRGNVRPANLFETLEAAPELLRRWPESEGVLWIRLDAPPSESEDPLECFPRPRFTPELREEIQRVLGRHAERLWSAGVEGQIRMLISRDGEVVFATIVNPTGWPAVDADIRRTFMRLRFDPARVDGTPREFWVEIPIRLR
jgi:hypothetical protein